MTSFVSLATPIREVSLLHGTQCAEPKLFFANTKLFSLKRPVTDLILFPWSQQVQNAHKSTHSTCTNAHIHSKARNHRQTSRSLGQRIFFPDRIPCSPSPYHPHAAAAASISRWRAVNEKYIGRTFRFVWRLSYGTGSLILLLPLPTHQVLAERL